MAPKQADGSTDATSSLPVTIGFRSSTLSSGAFNQRKVTGALSLTVPSGATLGQSNATAANLYLYALDNAGTVELAISGKDFGDSDRQSTTVLDTASDDGSTLYSTTARSNVPIRKIGKLINTQATAGTWATAPSTIQVQPNSTEFIRAAAGAVARSLNSKLSDWNSLVDYGGVGDGVTSNNTAEAAAEAVGAAIYVPTGAFKDTRSHLAPIGRYFGNGYSVDTNSRKRARYFSTISARPARGNTTAFDQIFDGDWSGSQLPIYHRVTGSNTAWDTDGAYHQYRELSAIYTYLRNESGYGGTLGGGAGAAVIAHAIDVNNASAQPNYTGAFWGGATINAAVSGVTDCLLNNAAGIFTGQVDTNVDGVYLNPVEINIVDNGHDVAGIGVVLNMARAQAATGSYANNFWVGFRPNSSGAAAADVAFEPVGSWKFGLDLTAGSYSSGAIAMKGGQRVYLNATAGSQFASAVGSSYLEYNTGASKVILSSGGSLFQFGADNGLYIPSTGSLKVAGVQVVQGRDTGWTAMTGSSDKATSYATSTVTLAQLAGRVMALQAALTSHGLIGA